MSKIIAISINTVREAFHKKTIYASLLFAFLLIAGSRVFTAISPGAETAFIKDISLGTIVFFGMLISVFSAATLIPADVESKRIWCLLTNPISRFQVILGKFLGVALTILITLFFMGGFLLLFLFLRGAPFDVGLLNALVLIFFQLFLLASITIMGSTFLSQVTSSIFALFIYLIGHLTPYFEHLGERMEALSLKFILLSFSKILPNFERFEIKDKLVVGLDIEYGLVASSIIYALLYSLIVLAIAWVFFNEKEV